MRHISVKRWQGHPERVRIHRPALTRRCRPGNRTKIIWKFIGRTRWPTTGMGQFSRRFISTVLWMSIISGGEFGSWRKTPFTCNLLRLNAFYMQMHPGQLGRICQDTEHRKFPFMIFNEPPFFRFASWLMQILGMLRLLCLREIWIFMTNGHVYMVRKFLWSCCIKLFVCLRPVPYLHPAEFPKLVS